MPKVSYFPRENFAHPRANRVPPREIPARGNFHPDVPTGERPRPEKSLPAFATASLTVARQQANGTRHKDKAAEKDAQRLDDALGTASPDKKGEAGKEEKKEKPKKKTPKDANGNDLKRPLSAYMLYNNHRRPVLRSEHPGK